MTRLLTAALCAGLAAPAALAAQQVTLADALSRAGRDAYPARIAAADAAAREGQAALALRGVLPSVRLEGGYVRTTEPRTPVAPPQPMPSVLRTSERAPSAPTRYFARTRIAPSAACGSCGGQGSG